MSIIGEQFDAFVQKQILTRQSLHGLKTRNDGQLNVLSNQNSWLKMGSSVKIESNDKGKQRLKDIGLSSTDEFIGVGLASNAVLFNSLSKYQSDTGYTQRSGVSKSADVWNSSKAYGLGGTDFGLVPPPGLISADIKAENRGSIRRCNITLKAFNKFQFELIELLYLRLGFSMLIEWGNNKYFDGPEYVTTGDTLMEKYWFNTQRDSFYKVLSLIDQERSTNHANYDGFLGKVTNFDWKFQPDGTYDITIKLVTVGDVIESLKVNLPQTTATVGEVNASIQGNVTPVAVGLSSQNSAIITNAGDSTLSYSLYSDVIDSNTGKWDGSSGGVKTNYISLLGLLGEETDAATVVDPQIGIQPAIPIAPATAQGGNTMKYSFFLTFKELLTKIETVVLPSINGDKILGINKSESQICALYPYQFSLDPRIAFIKPFFLSRFAYNSKEQFDAGKTEGGESGTGINNYSAWLNRVNNFGQKDNDALYGNIMNIYLNYDFITNILKSETNDKGEVFLFKFLQKICTGINDALGGMNNIECVLSNDREITFIEQNPIPGIQNSKNYGGLFSRDAVPFELYGYNKTNPKNQTSNFVRTFGFNTKIDSSLASSITIGATAEGIKTKNYDGTAFSKWNDGLEDRFSYEYAEPPPPPLLPPPPPSGSNATGAEPLTLDQIGQISAHFDAGTIDTYVGNDTASGASTTVFGVTLKVDFLGWLERKQTVTKFGGLEKTGFKDLPPTCPITGEKYNEITWEAYGQRVQSFLLNKAVEASKAAEGDKEDVVNYIAYCAQAMGGKINSSPVIQPQYFNFDDGFITIGKNSFKGWVNTISNKIYRKTGNPSNTIGFIPVDLNLTCDGISGIKIYQQLAIRQEFLPRSYPRALKFVIKNVNHKISNNDWTTELSTIATANVEKTVLSAEAFKIVEYDLTDQELKYATVTFAAGQLGTIMGGFGAIGSSGIPAGVDPRDIINPNKEGSKRYSKSPIAQYFAKKGVKNGINALIFPTMADTGEVCDTKSSRVKCPAHNNGTTTWYLNISAAGSWKRWKADALASGYKIGITNGYRSAAYQSAIGGVKGSAHGWGGAVDVNIRPTEGKLRHAMTSRSDYQKSKFKYNGKLGTGALKDRMAEDWKVVATLGARYGFFNPYRMANKPTQTKPTDEAWHFEYWGPPNNPNFSSDLGQAAATIQEGTPTEINTFKLIKSIIDDISLIFKLQDTFGVGGAALLQPAKGGNDDEVEGLKLYKAWIESDAIKKRTYAVKGADKAAFWKFLSDIKRKMRGNTGNDTATFTTTVGGKETFKINTDF